MVHAVKVKEEFFSLLVNEKKRFEVRKNDRNYKVGDFLVLNEIEDRGAYTDNFCCFRISYILNDPEYCKDGYVILSLQKTGLPYLFIEEKTKAGNSKSEVNQI